MKKLFGPPCTFVLKLTDEDKRRKAEVDRQSQRSVLPVYSPSDGVGGSIDIHLQSGKTIEHLGITVEVIGQILVTSDHSEKYDFTSLTKELEPAGIMNKDASYTFEFATVDKPYESYIGSNAQLRYFVRVTILRSYLANITFEQEFWVESCSEPPDINKGIKMEVGIEDSLHIEFEYDKSKYHLKDVILGKVYFLLVKLKIKHMEIALVKRETTGSGPNQYHESETVTRFEIMDGCPIRGELVPVRLFLSGYPLTPTYRNVNNKYSVKYFLNLVLVDEEDRRYFKQQEITLWRKAL
jgi:hypothetical protein